MKNKKVCIIGANGMLGHAMTEILKNNGYTKIISITHDEVDLRNQNATNQIMNDIRPDWIVFLAAVAAGIRFKKTHPLEILRDNVQMTTNVMNAAHKSNCKRLLNICSALIYPYDAKLPLSEEEIGSIDLNTIDTPYALSKAIGIKLAQFYRQEYGLHYFSAIPCNFYGCFAKFEGDRAGVVPSLIRRIHEAKINNLKEVVVWGTGNACRDILNSQDVASACIFLLEKDVQYDLINIGCGSEYTVREIAETIKEVIGYRGEIVFNKDMPEGRKHMQLNVDRIFNLGWRPKIPLADGIENTYKWYVNQVRDGKI